MRGTLHSFNTLKKLLLLYQSRESVDCTHIFKTPKDNPRDTDWTLWVCVFIESKEWRLIIMGNASVSMVVLYDLLLMKNDKYPRKTYCPLAKIYVWWLKWKITIKNSQSYQNPLRKIQIKRRATRIYKR